MEVIRLIESFIHTVEQLIGQFVHLWLSALGLIVVSVLYIVLYVGVVSSLVFFSLFFLIRRIRKRKTKKNAK
jgi:membrane protein implicated in regulation of membrane protease activity